MSYFVVADFKAGLNTTKLATTAAPGTLRKLVNAHITRGGEIEKRLAFASWAALPVGTVGLAGLSGVIYVFGTGPDPGVPPGVTYQRLVPADGSLVTRILDAKGFDGKLYVSALCNTGQVRHFYDGAQVTSFTGSLTEAEKGRILLTLGSNLYSAFGSTLFRSALDAPTDWDPSSTGAAFYNMATQASGSETLTGLGEYDSQMAVFSRRTVQIWTFSADPDAALAGNRLRNTGCVSPRSVLPFAGSDVFFLDDSGVRSLRSRDLTDSPSAADVGTPIDEEMAVLVRSLTADQLESVHAIIEPTSGRYWLVIGSTVYVFSYFPGGKISAWSKYTLPGEAVNTIAVDNQTYVRVGDTIYLYGGADGATYDDTVAEVELPYLDGRTVATWKSWTGIDIAADGNWLVYASYDPSVPTVEDEIATLTGTTYGMLDMGMLGESPFVKLRFTSSGAGAARLGNVAAHYERLNAG